MDRRTFLKHCSVSIVPGVWPLSALPGYSIMAVQPNWVTAKEIADMRIADCNNYREKILHGHPLLYRGALLYLGHPIPATESRPYVFCCGEGWLPLIERLSGQIEAEIVRLRDEEGIVEQHLPVAVQIKEKLGSLRFYVRGQNDTISAAIHATYAEADHTCEYCGARGKLRHNPRVTCCDDCLCKLA